MSDERPAPASPLMRCLMSIGNAFTGVLLRSPLHGLISRRFMLISVTGRKTGRTYTTPVNYARDGKVITVFSRRGRTWWRNLQPDAAPVTLRLRGRDVAAFAEVVPAGPATLAREFQTYYRTIAGRDLQPEQAAARTQHSVMLRIKLKE